MHWMDSAFRPGSIALFGASNTKGKMGYLFMKNLLDGYAGKIYPINKNESEILGIKAYSEIGEVPEPVDLAVVITPPASVPQIIGDCGRHRVKTAVVITSGFAEVGEEGKKLQDELVRQIKETGIRVIGPNCFGIQNSHNQLNVSLGLGVPEQKGNISLLTQSGAYGMSILSFAEEQSMGFAKVIAHGNKCDITDYEILEYLGQDEETGVICMFLESVEQGRKFFATAREVAGKKPVIVTKTGRSVSGNRAATSHTAALSSDHKTCMTAFRQSGLIWAETGLEMVDIAKAIDWQPLPKGKKVGIITNTGGMGVELVDLCEEFGLMVPELPEKDQQEIAQVIPPNASPKNPVDVTPLWSKFAEMYSKVMEVMYQSEQIDIVMPILLQRAAIMPEVAEAVRDTYLRHKEKGTAKPTYVCWVSPEAYKKNKKILQEVRIPVFEWPERTARVVAKTALYGVERKRIDTSHEENVIVEGNAESARIIKEYTDCGKTFLTEEESRRILELYGLQPVPAESCRTAEEAAEAAERIGYPVVMKIISPDIVHKSDAGGVVVNIRNRDELVNAAAKIIQSVKRYKEDARIDGLYVQKMASGVEVILGGVRDANFGPQVMFGLGGIFIEVLKDVVYRLAPVNRREAMEMLGEIVGKDVLSGARGLPPADKEKLADYIFRFSRMMVENAEIAEVDINPLLVNGSEMYAADARIVLK